MPIEGAMGAPPGRRDRHRLFRARKQTVACVCSWQQRLAAVTSTPRLPFRIGVHLGDMIEKVDGNAYGNGVNVAARLQSLASADEIWLSAAVRDTVGGRVARRMLDKGLHTVKNIDEPVHAFLLDWRSSADAPRPANVKPRRKAAWVLAGVSLFGLALSALLSSGAWHGVGARGEASMLRPLSVAIGTISAAPGDSGAAQAAERLRDDVRSELSRRHNLISVMADEGAIGLSAASAAPLRARRWRAFPGRRHRSVGGRRSRRQRPLAGRIELDAGVVRRREAASDGS